ncbi:MAG: ABC transporter permease [Candidatus Poseidoniaceae archaeon]
MGQEVIITGGRPSALAAPRLMARRLLRHRRLVRHLVVRDLKVTYHGTVIGYGWTMLEPLLLTAVYWAVFALLRGNEDPLFVLEILLGVLVYGLFSKTLSQTTTGLVGYAGLIKQTSVPREVFLWSAGAFQSLRFLLSCLVLPPTMFFLGVDIDWTLLLLPLIALPTLALGMGLGLIGAVMHTHVRDTAHVVGILTRAGFFLSGVFFGMRHIDPIHHDLFALNPVAILIEMSRSTMTGDTSLLQVEWVGRTLLVCVMVLVLGSIVFVRREAEAVKHL